MAAFSCSRHYTLAYMKHGRTVAWCVLLSFVCCSRAHAQADTERDIDTYTAAGKQALASGRYTEAEENFTALAKLEPRVAEVHATLGLIYFQQRNYSQAAAELRLAKKLQPGLTRTDSLLAMSLSELGDYKAALPGLEKAFQLSPDPAVKRMCGLQLMRAYTGLNEDGKAVQVALELNNLYPSDAEILYNTSRVFGNYAFLRVQDLAREAPNSVWRHLAAAEAYESQGSSADAIREYRAVLTVDPRRPGIHYRIARTLLAQSHQSGSSADLDAARQEYEQELALYPRNGNAAYEIAEIYRRAGQLDLAAQYFERALTSYPDFGQAQDGLAAVLIAQNKPEQALPHLKAAVTIDPSDEVCWYRLAQVDRTLGDSTGQQDALTHFRTLHQAAVQQQSTRLADPSTDVTRQEVDPASQP